MSHSGSLYRYTAFALDADGGNPAGVWIGETLPEESTMQRIAAEVGFSETAFVAPDHGMTREVRYFSPEIEVPFCGHATIATGVALGEITGAGTYRLTTPAGEIPVQVDRVDGAWVASLTSVPPSHGVASDELVSGALEALGWRSDELDPGIPPVIADAGARHLVLAARTLERLNDLDYDFDGLKAIMQQYELATLQLVWRENDRLFHARDPFPVGGVVEDPATGAAAAALGGYLRDAGLVEAPTELTVRQGEVMGRPSVLLVEIPESGGIIVTGHAMRLDT